MQFSSMYSLSLSLSFSVISWLPLSTRYQSLEGVGPRALGVSASLDFSTSVASARTDARHHGCQEHRQSDAILAAVDALELHNSTKNSLGHMSSRLVPIAARIFHLRFVGHRPDRSYCTAGCWWVSPVCHTHTREHTYSHT